MNANELAKLLEVDSWYKLVTREEIATMLRQQQAEIEALKAAKIRAYNNGVEDGRKPDTNNEPVAWMHKTATSWVSTFIHPETQPEEWIPLYTHLVKELTDSELTDIWKNKLCNQDCPREVYLAFYKEIRKAQKNG